MWQEIPSTANCPSSSISLLLHKQSEVETLFKYPETMQRTDAQKQCNWQLHSHYQDLTRFKLLSHLLAICGNKKMWNLSKEKQIHNDFRLLLHVSSSPVWKGMRGWEEPQTITTETWFTCYLWQLFQWQLVEQDATINYKCPRNAITARAIRNSSLWQMSSLIVKHSGVSTLLNDYITHMCLCHSILFPRTLKTNMKDFYKSHFIPWLVFIFPLTDGS